MLTSFGCPIGCTLPCGLRAKQGEVAAYAHVAAGVEHGPHLPDQNVARQHSRPAYRLTPRRCDCESRPVTELALPFLCAIAPTLLPDGRDLERRERLAGGRPLRRYDLRRLYLKIMIFLPRLLQVPLASTLMPLT